MINQRLFPAKEYYHLQAEQNFAEIANYLQFSKKHCTFALLIKKDGGIRPCEVLATCANKVLHSIPDDPETDK